MNKRKINRELAKVREQLLLLKKREQELQAELKMAEDAEKQNILERHHISVDELMKMINEKEKEKKKILEEGRTEMPAFNNSQEVGTNA